MRAHIDLHRQAHSAHTQTNTRSQTHSRMDVLRAFILPSIHIKASTHPHVCTPTHSHACVQFQMCMPRARTPSNTNTLRHTLQGHAHTSTHKLMNTHPHVCTHSKHRNMVAHTPSHIYTQAMCKQAIGFPCMHTHISAHASTCTALHLCTQSMRTFTRVRVYTPTYMHGGVSQLHSCRELSTG